MGKSMGFCKTEKKTSVAVAKQTEGGQASRRSGYRERQGLYNLGYRLGFSILIGVGCCWQNPIWAIL